MTRMRRTLAAGVLALLLITHAVWFYAAIGWDAVDDAYISYVYARNAILGHGLTFNPSERVEGFTNFLWTALMVPLEGAGLDVGRASSALGVAFGLGTLALVVRLPRRLGLPEAVGWLAALFLAVDGSFALWSVSGLETPLFAFLILLGATLYLKENGGGSSGPRLLGVSVPLSGIVFALAATTRPEAAAVFALTVAHSATRRVVGGNNENGICSGIRRENTGRRGWVEDAARVGVFGALFVPYWLVRWRYYHSFLPNSFYAKVAAGGPTAQIERGWNHVQQFMSVHLGWLVLLPALVALVIVTTRYVRARRVSGQASRSGAAFWGLTYCAALVVAYGAYIVYVGGDWSVGRFFVPIEPFAYVLTAAGLVWTWDYAVRRSTGTPAPTHGAGRQERPSLAPTRIASWRQLQTPLATTGVVVAGLLAFALWFESSYNGEFRIFIGGFDAARATAARVTAGKWLRANVPPGTWIAVDAAGQVPYFSGLPAIDMFGINDLHIGRMPVATLGQGTPGHEKFDLGYILTRAPEYVIIYGTLFESVKEYKRAPVTWTDDPELTNFLTIYQRAR